MRLLFSLLLLVTGPGVFAQDTSGTWLNNIDPTAFSVKYDKRRIPEELRMSNNPAITPEVFTP